MADNIKRGDRITSTSNVTIDDIVKFVVSEIKKGQDGNKLAEAWSELAGTGGRVPVVVAPKTDERGNAIGGGDGASTYCGDGKCGEGGCIGTTGASDGGAIRKGCGCGDLPKLATTSKWYNTVLQNGEVWTPYTSRRFLPAQYLGLMHRFGGNIDAAIARTYTLRECFRILENEIGNLIFMRDNWRTAFAERSMFLTVDDVVKICTDYLGALHDNVNDRSKCGYNKRKQTFWRYIKGEGTVELWTKRETDVHGDNGEDTHVTSVTPTKWLTELNEQIRVCRHHANIVSSYEDAIDLVQRMPHVCMGTFLDGERKIRYWLPKRWKECFKKEGAYYTLKSLVVNRHVRLTEETGDWRRKETVACETAREGLDKLARLRNHDVPAYVVHAILKKSIEASRLDLGKFLRDIRKH
jgi:hypothetical protein